MIFCELQRLSEKSGWRQQSYSMHYCTATSQPPSWLKLALNRLLGDNYSLFTGKSFHGKVSKWNILGCLQAGQAEWNPVARSYLLPLFSTNHHHNHHAPITTTHIKKTKTKTLASVAIPHKIYGSVLTSIVLKYISCLSLAPITTTITTTTEELDISTNANE